MSELHDEIENLSAVLEFLQAEARGGQSPVLRLASSHLRLLAKNLKGYGGRDGATVPPAAPPLPSGALLPPVAAAEASHVRQ